MVSSLEIKLGDVIAERNALRVQLEEMEKAEVDRQQAEESLRFTQFLIDHAADPSFWIGEDGRYLYVNDAACQCLGYSREEMLGKSLLEIDPDLTPETLPGHWDRIKQAGAMAFEARHRRKNGEIFPVEVTVNHLEFRGRQYHCTFTRDITDRKRAEDALRKSKDYLQTVIDGIADPILVIDRQFQIVLANRAVRRRAGGIDPVSMHLTCHQVSHHSAVPCVDHGETCPLAQVLATGEPMTVTHVHKDVDGGERTYEVTGWPMRDESGQVVQMIEYCRDVTERRKAERSVEHLNAVLRAMRLIDQLIGEESDPGRLLEGVCRSLVKTGGYAAAWIALTEGSGKVRRFVHAGLDSRYASALEHLDQGTVPDCVRRAIENPGVTVIDDPRKACAGCSLKDVFQDTAALCTRLECDGTVYGLFVVSVPRDLAARAAGGDLFGEVAADVSAALRNLELAAQRREIEAELEQSKRREAEIGFRIQQMLLLGSPPSDMPGLDVAAVTEPSQYIDGDFYDFFRHNDQCLDVMVGDVMGKGVPAALLGAATKSHLQRAISSLIASGGGQLPSPSEIVAHVHEGITRQLINLESFVTLCYARVDLHAGRMDFVDCGHTETILWRGRTGDCELLHGMDLFLGVTEQCRYQQVSVAVAPGDLLVFYSDGVIEARNAEGEFFGLPRLIDLVKGHGGKGSAEVVGEIVKAVREFSGYGTFADDVTCVAVRLLPQTPQPLETLELTVPSEASQMEKVRGFVAQACARCPGHDEEGTMKLELAVHEAATNIIKHAYRGKGDCPIHVVARVFTDRVEIRLHHKGEALDVARGVPRELDYSRDNGFGLYIIGQAANEVNYSADEDGNSCVRLTKVFAQPAAAKESES